jgi:hypothetical protein
MCMLWVIIFGSVRFLSKKVTKPNCFLKKPETESKPVQTDRFRFGSVRFFRTKTGSNRFGSVFCRFGSFFSGFSSVWFGFFGFRLIKLKLNRTGWFFQNFNRFNQFFSQFGFFSYFFQVFSVFRFFYSPLVHVPTTFLK